MNIVRLFRIVTVWLLALTACSVAAEGDAAAVRRTMEGLYARIDAATEAGDIDAIGALLLPDATLEGPPGTGFSMPLRTSLDQTKKLLQDGTKILARSTVRSVELGELHSSDDDSRSNLASV